MADDAQRLLAQTAQTILQDATELFDIVVDISPNLFTELEPLISDLLTAISSTVERIDYVMRTVLSGEVAPGAILYKGEHLDGEDYPLARGSRHPYLDRGFDDHVSSVRVNANNGMFLAEKPRLKGVPWWTLPRGEYNAQDLKNRGISHVSSVRVYY